MHGFVFDRHDPCGSNIEIRLALDLATIRKLGATMFHSGYEEPKVIYALEKHVERWKAIEAAAAKLMEVVRETHDHTQWFKAISDLNGALLK